MMSPAVAVLTLLLTSVVLVRGHGQYRQYLPNRGEHVACDGQEWPAVGHMYPLPQGGPFPRNPFGMEFRQFRVMDEDPNGSYRPQYQALCQRDSDGDGVSNGQELGDADCDGVLDQNLNNDRLGHPGFCEARRGRCGAGASYCPDSQGARQGSQFSDQFRDAQSQGTNIPQTQSSGFQPQVSRQEQTFLPSQQLQLPTQFFTQQSLQQIPQQEQQHQFFPQQSQQPMFPQNHQSQFFPPQPEQQVVPQAIQQQSFLQQPPQLTVLHTQPSQQFSQQSQEQFPQQPPQFSHQIQQIQQQPQQFPQQPQQQFPQQPQQQFPQQPQQQFPQQPQQQFPQQPQQQFPQQPQQQFPQQPQQFPQQPQQPQFPQQPQQQFPQHVQERFTQQMQQQFQNQRRFIEPNEQQRLQQPQNQFMIPNPQTQGISPRQRVDQGPVSVDTFQSQGVVPWWNWPS